MGLYYRESSTFPQKTKLENGLGGAQTVHELDNECTNAHPIRLFVAHSWMGSGFDTLCPFPFGHLPHPAIRRMGKNNTSYIHKNRTFPFPQIRSLIWGKDGKGVKVSPTSSPLPYAPRSNVVARAAFVRPKQFPDNNHILVSRRLLRHFVARNDICYSKFSRNRSASSYAT